MFLTLAEGLPHVPWSSPRDPPLALFLFAPATHTISGSSGPSTAPSSLSSLFSFFSLSGPGACVPLLSSSPGVHVQPLLLSRSFDPNKVTAPEAMLSAHSR